jgi:hypothetical protein
MSYATAELMRLDDPSGWRPVDIDLGQQDGKRVRFIGIVKNVGDGTLQARGIFKIGSPGTES